MAESLDRAAPSDGRLIRHARPKASTPIVAPSRLRASRWRALAGRRILVIAPSLIASFVYVFVFTFWTLYISLSNSTLLPTYQFVGFKPYYDSVVEPALDDRLSQPASSSASSMSSLRAGRRASRSPSRSTSGCRAKSLWRTIFLYPLAVSFVVTGTVWSWLYSPNAGIEYFVRGLGWTDFTFRLTTNRDTAIYAIIATGVWQSSGFAMALFLAGLRSVDPDLVKAAADRRRQPAFASIAR